MNRYIALLRGINISGKNKISMPELRAYLEKHGFGDVLTYLNSGNVIFSSEENNEALLADSIGMIIREHFGLDIPVYIIRRDRLEALLDRAPEWWGTDDRDKYHNLIFVLPVSSPAEISEKIGSPTEELEQIFICDDVIFHTFDRAKYAKANWWKKTAAKGIGEMLTIRTANTLRKIVKM